MVLQDVMPRVDLKMTKGIEKLQGLFFDGCLRRRTEIIMLAVLTFLEFAPHGLLSAL